MMIIQLVFILGLVRCFSTTGESETVRLQNTWFKKCLSYDGGILVGRDCDTTDGRQEWRWINNLILENINSRLCLQRFTTDPVFRMENCDPSLEGQHFAGTFNFIRSTLSPVAFLCLVSSPFELSICRFSSVSNRWKVYGGSGEKSICGNPGGRIWWKGKAMARHIGSGLNPFILYIRVTPDSDHNNVGMIDSAGKIQKLTGIVHQISVARDGVWVTNPNFALYFVGQGSLAFGQSTLPWEYLDGNIALLDFSMPGKGFVVRTDKSFCARLGITDDNPKGNGNWSCSAPSETIEDFSCGVTGCFATIGGNVYFRQGITDALPQGQEWVEVGNPSLGRSVKIEAGPVYELWAVDAYDLPYRRLGMSDSVPIGTAWERVPDHVFDEVSLGIYGPVGTYANDIVMSNGSPTLHRQREMNTWCTNTVPQCTTRDISKNCYGSEKCHARFSPSASDDHVLWRCFSDKELRVTGMVWRNSGVCYWARSRLKRIANRYPVLGDFEKQLWLDQHCQNPEVNLDVLQCDMPYFADFSVLLNRLVCRTTNLTSTCPVKTGLNSALAKLKTASCADIPLLNSLADSLFEYKSDSLEMYASFAKFNVPNKAWCIRQSVTRSIFMRIDFRFLHKICAVATKGKDGKYVDRYRVSYSTDDQSYADVSLFGTRVDFPGAATFKKHYLPAPVEGRYFRITYVSQKNVQKCLKLELYGSSKEFMATSCQYYKDHLFASRDGYYNIYPKDTNIKRRVFCKGITDAGPAQSVPNEVLGVDVEHIGCFGDSRDRVIPNKFSVSSNNAIAECHSIASGAGYQVFGVQFQFECFTGPDAHTTYDKNGSASNCINGKGGKLANDVYRIKKVDDKLFWALNTSSDGSPGTLIHGRHAARVLQSSNTRIIADFPGHCVSDPTLCRKGFSIRLWIWFRSPPEPLPYSTRVLQTGHHNSRCFVVSIEHNHVCMKAEISNYTYKACVGSMGEPTSWLQVVAVWDSSTGVTLTVDDLAFRSRGGGVPAFRKDYYFYDSDSVLRLGDHKSAQSRRYEIAVHSLTIWPRKLSESEVESFFTKGYTIAAAGESCKATCDAEQLACEPLMTANLTNVLKGLGQDCPSIPPYDAEDESQPYITTDGACHGISDVRDTSCDASKSGVRRLCRCEKPVHGQFTEWTQWSFCSRTCGSGRRVRTRTCTHPAPRLGGRSCEGITIMHEDCQESPCGATNGVLREVWICNHDAHLPYAYRIKYIRGYPNWPSFTHIIENFLTPNSSWTHYGERLLSSFRAPYSGNYSFTMKCPESCTLYFTRPYQFKTNIVGANNGPFTKKSKQVTLVRGELYTLDVIRVITKIPSQFSLGFEHLDSGFQQNPIGKDHLFWESKSPQGVSRAVWNTRSYALEFPDDLPGFINRFPVPDHQDVLTTFEVPEYGHYYLQRLQSYFLAPITGSYDFYMACSGQCSFYQADSYQFSTSGVATSSKYTDGQTHPMLLEGGSFYHVKVLHYVESVTNYIVFGVRLPDGTELRPITNSYLWLNIPEKLKYGNTAVKLIKYVSPHYGSLAIDNNPSTCSLTKQVEDPWLRLYTWESIYVRVVALTNSIGNPSYLHNAVVKVGYWSPAGHNHNKKCYGPVPNIQAGKTVAFPCNPLRYGRYVSVHIFGTKTLSICEIVVYGEQYDVHRKHYGQGMIDGRIEQQSLYTSGSISGSTKQFGRLFHPSYHSWCASLKDDTKYFRVDFVENRVILGIVLQGHALEHKYINRMRIEAYVDKKWETVRNTRNQQTFYSAWKNTVEHFTFKQPYVANILTIFPLQWINEPCFRLEILGAHWPNDFVWKTNVLKNDTKVEYRPEQSQGEKAVVVPQSSAVKFHGFNVECLTNPRACHGSFVLKFALSFTDRTSDGIILSTTGYNTSVIGTSLFLKGSELTASIRTDRRAWKVSAPIDMAINTFQNISVQWSYTGDIVLDIGSNTHVGQYSIVTHVPSESFDGVLHVGGVDMLLYMTSFKVQSYTLEWSKRIHYAVDGLPTEWESWGYCSKSCGNTGVQYRYRRCLNPAPKFDGFDCPENTLKEMRPCPKPSCEAADGVLREVWMNKGPPEFTLANVFDGYASHLEVVANFSLSYNDGPFAERLRTFLRAGESGGFEFQLSCTYQCELWISPNDEADDKEKIASHYGTGNAEGSESALSASYNFETGENYYIEVRSFDIIGARNHTLMTIKALSATVPGTGFSLIRHKPGCYHGLGMESGAIPDTKIHSLKFWEDSPFAYAGRLNSLHPHCYGKNIDEKLYVYLEELHWISAIVLQGFDKDGVRGYVPNFSVKTRFDTEESGFTTYDNQFTGYDGNNDPDSIKIVNLTEPVRSKIVVIRIENPVGDGCLRLDFIGCHAGNIARGKVVSSSANSGHLRSNDGSYVTSYGHIDCTVCRLVDDYVWWTIDFGIVYYIGEVFIVGRRDCCRDRMRNLIIRVGNSSSNDGLSNPQCVEEFSMTSRLASSAYCDPYGVGKYLTISKHDTDTDMTFCEVAIFRLENDTVFSNWSDCSVTCGYGIQQRHTICTKPYYCKSKTEVKPCFAGEMCEILMQNCGQLHALGETETGVYKVRPDPEIENDIYIYCDHDTDGGGWLVLQRRSGDGSLNMTQSWDMYRDGFGNVSTEFWIGNKYLSQLTNHTAYEIMFLFTYANGSVLKKTKCDAFNVSSEEENYRLELGSCEGPDAEVLRDSNWTEFATSDNDNGFNSLHCTNGLTGWWYGSCDSYLNKQVMSCFGLPSCDYHVTMMIKPNKVDGGWTHWTSWETCDKPCGGGNSSRVRSCTQPPPTGGGADCEGPWNKTRGCNTSPCPAIEVNLTMRFTEEQWSANLDVSSSPSFVELLTKIKDNIKALYENDPSVNVLVHSFRQGSVIADVTLLYEALDGQQLIVLQEDLDQDGLLNQDMPVVYTRNEIVTTEVLFGPPQEVELSNTSSTSILVEWQPPNSTVLYKILGYRIFYKKSNDTSLSMFVQAVEKNVLELEITDLEHYTNYSVRVCAFSSAGNGVPTAAHHVITDEYVPMAAPVEVSAYNTSSTSLNISWLAMDPVLFRGIPTGYVLHYRVRTSDNTTAFFNATIDDYLVTTINISDLMKYTEYEMYMTATTVKGEGIRGEFVYFWTDEDVPSGLPENVTLVGNTSTSLNISWSAVPPEFVHGVLRAYVIEYWPVDDVNDTANTTVEPWKTEVEITNLKKFTNYTLKFAAMTAKGVGNWSEIMVQTDEDVPDHGPLSLTGFNTSSTALNISWGLIPKEYRNGIITGYRVHFDDNIHHSGSITLPFFQRNVVLEGLLSYSLYNISVAGLTRKGEGWSRTFVMIRTDAGAPSREPWELLCSDVSSYTVSLHWYRFTPDLTGSLLTGYFISYKAIYPPHPTVYNVTLEPFKHNYVAENMKAFTNYSFELYVFNPWGRSNSSTVVCRTEEGKPLSSPSNVLAISKLAPDKVLLKWETVPDLLMAGIRRGYTVTYIRTMEAGDSVLEDSKRVDIFDPEQMEIMIGSLDSYSQYSFAVRVFNTKFYGDYSESVYGETCNCLRDFYANWCTYLPYVNTSDSGIFPPLITGAINGVCGNCSEFGEPRIFFDVDGSSLRKTGLMQVKQGIDENHQISFPIIGRKDSKTFVPVIDSPGSVFITKKPSLTMTVEYMFFDTIIGTLPLLGFAVITASLAGLIMWCLENKKNSEHFPRRFSRGAPEGFWFAFVSMTTVGYGDRIPVTMAGRIFALMWTLYGLVITGLLVGNLTSSLTASVAFSITEVDLYQAKIAAIENSSEFKLGLSKGAFVNKGRNYSDILTVLHAVEVGSVEGALLDMYVVASRPELQKKDSPLMVKTVINNPSVCGVELAGHARKLRKPFLKYLQNNAAMVSRSLEEHTNPVKESEGEVDTSEVSDENEINVLAPNSPIIATPLLYSWISFCAAFVFGLLAHYTLCRSRRKKETAVSPISNSAQLRLLLNTDVKKFCKSSKTTIRDIKLKHQQELKRVAK